MQSDPFHTAALHRQLAMTFASPHNTGPATPSADSNSKDVEPDLSMSALAAASAWSHSHPSEHRSHSHPHSHLSHETEGDREADTARGAGASRPLVAQVRDMRVGDIEDAASCAARKNLGANAGAGAGVGHGSGVQPQDVTYEGQGAGSPKKGRTCPNGNSGCSCPFSQ